MATPESFKANVPSHDSDNAEECEDSGDDSEVELGLSVALVGSQPVPAPRFGLVLGERPARQRA